MKIKKVLCVLLAAMLTLGSTSVLFAAETTGKYVLQISKDKELNDGFFYVDLKVENNPGINSITGYIEYDPTKVIAVESVVLDEQEPIILLEGIDKQINDIPSSKNKEYEDVGANGEKTCAELGRVKIAGYIKECSEDNDLEETKENGIVCRILFEVVKEGNASISYKNINTSSFEDGKQVLRAMQDAEVIYNSQGGDNYLHLLGDVTHDGDLTIGDVTRTLNTVVEQKILTSDELLICDVTGDEDCTIGDVTKILNWVLDQSTLFGSKGEIVMIDGKAYVVISAPCGESSCKGLVNN